MFSFKITKVTKDHRSVVKPMVFSLGQYVGNCAPVRMLVSQFPPYPIHQTYWVIWLSGYSGYSTSRCYPWTQAFCSEAFVAGIIEPRRPKRMENNDEQCRNCGVFMRYDWHQLTVSFGCGHQPHFATRAKTRYDWEVHGSFCLLAFWKTRVWVWVMEWTATWSLQRMTTAEWYPICFWLCSKGQHVESCDHW